MSTEKACCVEGGRNKASGAIYVIVPRPTVCLDDSWIRLEIPKSAILIYQFGFGTCTRMFYTFQLASLDFAKGIAGSRQPHLRFQVPMNEAKVMHEF